MKRRRQLGLALLALAILGLGASWLLAPEIRASWHKALMTYEGAASRQARLERLTGSYLNLSTFGPIRRPRGEPAETRAVCRSVLIYALRDEAWYNRRLAASYLTDQDPLSPELRSALGFALRDEDPGIRQLAFRRLTRGRFAHVIDEMEAYQAWEKAGRPKL